ncbi:MAG: hypothetical protein OXB84_02865, partial [Halobacteriovoraceae bacterium]|nr:hypothetical protein [Halobacteriovoraceae bacterium]
FRAGKNENRLRVKIEAVGLKQLFLENSVSLEEVDSILQVTIYLNVGPQWKAYQIINVYPDLESQKDGKVKILNFQLGEAEKIDFEEVFSYILSDNSSDNKLAA